MVHLRPGFVVICLAAVMTMGGISWAADYDFISAPALELNLIYRIDRATGEVGACQYAVKDGGGIGVTLCYPAGDGANPGLVGDYTLVASRHEKEYGVFRVDRRTGTMAVCYVLDKSVVCTPSAR